MNRTTRERLETIKATEERNNERVADHVNEQKDDEQKEGENK